ncbi:hypothetical protein GGF31_001263, partial [Allomyces arbusculus]
MFALRAPATHDSTHPYPVSACEPVVLAPSDAGTPAIARSLVETLMQAHSTMPLAGPAVALVRNLLSVTPNLTEIVRGVGGVATNVPSSAQWHLDLMNRYSGTGLVGSATAADMSRRSRQWERRFYQVFGHMIRPQSLYLDKDANMLS